MRILCWNIAGGHTVTEGAQHTLSYEKENLEYFIQQIKEAQADVVLLQEVHISDEESQAKIIARELSYKYFREHSYGQSHIKDGNHLSLATLSNYPITHSYFHLLPNPKISVQRPNGDTWISLDVGFLITEISYNDKKINLANCHLVPFHYFKRDFVELAFQNIRDDISSLMLKFANKPTIIAGDFNYADLRIVTPDVFREDLYQEAFEGNETALGRGQQDHILFSKQWNLKTVTLKKVRADHYQCLGDFELIS